ncbi:tumor necrosis factor receptor superfamily member 16 [Strongylocentrotus purpuratus]|uniref:TNFR-Cys domain-containing protein n=1 Tax=Strongylocentrotus purpuratus TaxID=7668 RepID=A0A7M7NH52_STRPU|nr:tumor necrosis factor receptor superfamily member 16 [Strongylocentrotus purpuratus]
MMDKTRENALRTWIFLLVIFLIILHCGSADEDQHETESKAAVSMIPDQGPRRAERDVSQSNPNDCYPDEYFSDYYWKCIGCTRCSRGTQHDPQEPCGNGRGQEAHCTPCDEGYYQSHEGIAVLTCRPCLTCDQRAVIERTCSRQRNTLCGKCQKGWYYNETNACVECTERDLADPTNEDCYVKPDPTPGPNLTPTGPQSGPGPNPDLSTRAPVPTVDGASSEPLPIKPAQGKAVNPQTQNALRDWHVGLICVAVAASLVVLMAGFILYKLKNKKRKDVPPPANVHEMENLYVGPDEQKHNHHRPGPSGPPSDEANNPMGGLMPPSSHLDPATESIPGPPEGLPVDTSINQDGHPTRNFVTTDTTHVPQPGPEDLSNDGPPSNFHSLKSFQPGDYIAGFQVPARHADVSQSPDEMVDPCAQMVDPCDQVTRYEDQSLQSGFKSLSSFLHHNTPGSPHRLI